MQHGVLADGRFGSLADILASQRHVRFSPGSGHMRCKNKCSLWAKSGHWPYLELSSFLRRSICFVATVACIRNSPELFTQCISVQWAGRRQLLSLHL